MEKRLVRKKDDRMLFGVASGIAEYLNIDTVIVRLIFVLLALAGGPGVLIYLVLLIVMPEEDVMTEAKANAFDEEEIVIKDEE